MANAVELKQQADSVRATLERMKGQFELALPKHLTPDRLLRVAMTAVQNTPKLLECDRQSLFSALMACAQLGLEPDGVLGQAYLVPFAGKVQFIPGYKGLLTLARNTGEITSIQAHAVRRGDEFDFAYGLEERLHHKPSGDDESDDAITHFYAYAKYRDGGHSFEVMTRAAVEKIRDKSQGWQAFLKYGGKTNPWKDHFEQMGRKTAIRRLANYLPRQVQKAVEIENAYDRGIASSLNELGEVVFLEAPAEEAQDKAAITNDQRMTDVATTGGRRSRKTADEPKVEDKPAPAADAGNKPAAAGNVTSTATAGVGTSFAAEVEKDAAPAGDVEDFDPETGEIIEKQPAAAQVDEKLQDLVDTFLDELGRTENTDALERLLRSWQNQVNDKQIAAFGNLVNDKIEARRELLKRRATRSAASSKDMFGDS